MTGNTISEFIDSLYLNCDKEIAYHGGKIMIEGWLNPENSTYTLHAYKCSEGYPELFLKTDADRTVCVSAFEKAEIFDGKTIYEAADDIDVLYD